MENNLNTVEGNIVWIKRFMILSMIITTIFCAGCAEEKTAEDWTSKGDGLYYQGKYEEAIASYNKAIVVDSQYAAAWNNKGVVLNEMGRYEEALQAYDKAIEANPKFVKAWNNKGVVLEKLGRNAEAQVCYDKAKESQNSNTITSSKTTEQSSTEYKQTPEKVYAINENINVDYLTYRVTKVETFNKMGFTAYSKETNGKFIKVYIDIINNAKETKNIFSPRFKIEDSQGRMYDQLPDDYLYIADYIEFGKQVQPGLMTSGAVVFELPKDSSELKLIISGDWASISEAKVTLSNIQDIGIDTTRQDEQDAQMDAIMKESYAKAEEMMQTNY